jgi:hypothetical protein
MKCEDEESIPKYSCVQGRGRGCRVYVSVPTMRSSWNSLYELMPENTMISHSRDI